MATEHAKKVAKRLIEQFKAGTAPWQKPWQPGEQFMPYNPTTGKEYRGGNTLWLMAQGHLDQPRGRGLCGVALTGNLTPAGLNLRGEPVRSLIGDIGHEV